jgi:phosphoribosylformylglycinamidine cyclo-ligase
MSADSYKSAGVDIDAGNRTVELMRAAIRATYSAEVLADVGSFGGLFALANLPPAPVLVASTDGVGTKVKLAAERGDTAAWQGIGQDLVNHCVNDILVQNARPLFFLDYIAASRLVPETAAAIVTGIAAACRAAGCALLGGETAEMPGVYAEGAVDLAGTIVGLVDRSALLPRQADMAAGDALVGLPSSGPHTNGYSLIRKAVAGRDLRAERVDGVPLIDALLAPHRSYLSEVDQIQRAGHAIKGMAHITGGGFLDNVPRVLPPHLSARIVAQSWRVPAVFRQLAAWSGMAPLEAYRVFNMGIGMVLVVDAAAAEPILDLLPEAVVVGRLIERRAGAEGTQVIF